MRSLLALLLLVAFAQPTAAESRLKDIAEVQGIRDNQLVGYGLVIGLSGTGDSMRNAPFTEQSARSMLQKLGVGVPSGAIRSRNIAAVVATATLPPFVAVGERIDVNVSSLGDSTSLAGGTLVLTPLTAADGQAYAVAQGSVAISGFSAAGQAESVTEGVPTSGRIVNGALIERKLAGEFNSAKRLALQIRNPDFATAARIADAVNSYAREKFGQAIATERDFRTVEITRPAKVSASRLMALIGDLSVDVDVPARIVIDERTGTIVIGSAVRVLPVAITHGTLTIKISEQLQVSQPSPFSDGVTAVEPTTTVDTSQPEGRLAILEGPSLDKLVQGLNRMGLKPSGIIAILQAIKSAGALQAELVVQ
ncbi:MAG: flagellar basal body P-ring protein FlgI [Alphaproteobacteria bacterium]|nr:flagellar basal body P-ring protein FlgI [Alphaproteobacteria bacterium]